MEWIVEAVRPSGTVAQQDMGALLSALLDRALAAHNSGDFDTARKIYSAILSEDPGHFQAAHMLGTLLLQTGRTSQAEAMLRRALTLEPHSPEALTKLGLVLVRQGRTGDGIAAYDRALAFNPKYRAALANKANALSADGRSKEAIAAYDQVIALEPEVAENYYNRGVAFDRLEAHEEAAQSYRFALQRRPDFPEALNNLGNALRSLGRCEDALAVYGRAVAQKPDYAQAYVNRAAAAYDLRRFADARRDLEKALVIDPKLPEAWCNLGNVERETGRIEMALERYAQALVIRPDDAQTRWNRAFTQLLSGHWRDAWVDYELRHAQRLDLSNRDLRGIPQWTGQPLKGRTILLYSEQGLGDAIQFCRFAQILVERGASVTLLAPTRLRRLLATLDGITVVDEVDPAQRFDFWTPLMGLVRFLDLTPDRIAPLAAPYLRAEPERIAAWSERLGRHLGDQGFRVGICWQGNPAGSTDSGRSIPLAQFAPLGRVAGVRLISLQRGRGAEQLGRLPAGMAVESFPDLDKGPDGFLDTAAIMANLDLMITSDTSVAHLAGALGREAWVALKMVPDWRWLRQGRDTPWYPAMRLYRQSRFDDWAGVFQDIAADLAKRKTLPKDS